MKLLGSTKKDVDQDKEIEVVLVHCNVVNNTYHNYQQASKLLFIFVPNKQFGQLINISPHSLTMLSVTNTECSFIKVRFTDRNSEPLAFKDNVTMILIIG